MKTKEELNALKEEDETLNKKLVKLPDEELAQVTGGIGKYEVSCPFCGGVLEYLDHDCPKKRDFYYCRNGDGYLTYFWEGARWEKGWITD